MKVRCWALVVAIAFSSACADERGSETVRLRVLVNPFLSHAPMLLAQDEGYFREQGIEVEFIRLNDPAAGAPMLIDGGLDVLAGSASPGLLNAMADGLHVRAVAEKGFFRAGRCSLHGLLIRRDLLDAAAGGTPAVRRISVDRQPQQLYVVERMLESVGVKLDDLEKKYIPHLPEMTALAEGNLDVALAGEPWLTINLENNPRVTQWVRAEDVLPNHQISFLYFGPSLLDNDPDTGKRFLSAYLKGVRRFEQGPTPELLAQLARLTGEGAEIIERMCWPAFEHDARIDFEGVAAFQEWALARGLIKAFVPEATFWDPTFIEAANRSLEPHASGEGSES